MVDMTISPSGGQIVADDGTSILDRERWVAGSAGQVEFEGPLRGETGIGETTWMDAKSRSAIGSIASRALPGAAIFMSAYL